MEEKILKRNLREFNRFRWTKFTLSNGRKIKFYHSLHRSEYETKDVIEAWMKTGSKLTVSSIVNFVNNLNLPGVFAMTPERYQKLLRIRKKNNGATGKG